MSLATTDEVNAGGSAAPDMEQAQHMAIKIKKKNLATQSSLLPT
jgi:hypothetical protein